MKKFDNVLKKDGLTDRLAKKYACIHLTVELLNQVFDYGLNALDIINCLITSEQNCFEERDNVTKAYQYIVDFISKSYRHFKIETCYTNQYNNTESLYPQTDIYGKIIKIVQKVSIHLTPSFPNY